MTFVERLVRKIDDAVAPEGPLLWRGNIYSIYPANPVFFPHDEAFYFYHMARPTLEFFLNRRVTLWETGRPYHREDLIEIFPRDGGVVTHEDRFHLTHLADQLPDTPVPIRLDVITRRSFAATGRSPLVLKDRRDPNRQIRLRRTPLGYAVPAGLAGGGWHVFSRDSAGARPEPVLGPLTRPPFAIELLRVERSEFGFRE